MSKVISDYSFDDLSFYAPGAVQILPPLRRLSFRNRTLRLDMAKPNIHLGALLVSSAHKLYLVRFFTFIALVNAQTVDSIVPGS
jgi:hypothetical protein